jgi:hypothetical protein
MSIDGQLTEKQVEHLGDKLMQAVGFEIIRFSQPRNTMQSPGIPDRRYYHPSKKLAVWWEAKSAKGKQSMSQQDFQSMVQNVGEEYLVGTDDVLVTWLRWKGLVR